MICSIENERRQPISVGYLLSAARRRDAPALPPEEEARRRKRHFCKDAGCAWRCREQR